MSQTTKVWTRAQANRDKEAVHVDVHHNLWESRHWLATRLEVTAAAVKLFSSFLSQSITTRKLWLILHHTNHRDHCINSGTSTLTCYFLYGTLLGGPLMVAALVCTL